MQTKYNTSEIMKILGKQYNHVLISPGGPAYNDFREVIEANSSDRIRLFDVGLDFFSLGYLYGIRAERAAKQHKELTPLTGGKKNGNKEN